MKKIAKYGLLCGIVMFAGISGLNAKTFTAKELAEKTSTVETIDGVQIPVQENIYVFGSHVFVNNFTTLNIVEASVTIDFNKKPILYLKDGNGNWKDALRPNENVNIKDSTTFEVTKMIKEKTGNEGTITGEGNATVSGNTITETFPSSGNPSVPVIPDTESAISVVSVVKKDNTDTDENFTVSFDSTKKTLVINEDKPAKSSTTVADNGNVILVINLGDNLDGSTGVSTYTAIDFTKSNNSSGSAGTNNPTLSLVSGTKTVELAIPQTDKSYENISLMFIDNKTKESTIMYVTYNAKERVEFDAISLDELTDSQTLNIATNGVVYEYDKTTNGSFVVSNKDAFEFSITTKNVAGQTQTENYTANKKSDGTWVMSKVLNIVDVIGIDNTEDTIPDAEDAAAHKQNTEALSFGKYSAGTLNIDVTKPMITYANGNPIVAEATGEWYAILVDLGFKLNADSSDSKVKEIKVYKDLDENGKLIPANLYKIEAEDILTTNLEKHFKSGEVSDTAFMMWLKKAPTRTITFVDANNDGNRATLTINMTDKGYTPLKVTNVTKVTTPVTDADTEVQNDLKNQDKINNTNLTCEGSVCTIKVESKDAFVAADGNKNYALVLNFGNVGNDDLTFDPNSNVKKNAADIAKYGVNNGVVVILAENADSTFTVTKKNADTITVKVVYEDIEVIGNEDSSVLQGISGTVSNIVVTKQTGVDTTKGQEITAESPKYYTTVVSNKNVNYFAVKTSEKIEEFTFTAGNDKYLATNNSGTWSIAKMFKFTGKVMGGSSLADDYADSPDLKYNQESIGNITSTTDKDGKVILNVELNRELYTNDTYSIVLDLGTTTDGISESGVTAYNTTSEDNRNTVAGNIGTNAKGLVKENSVVLTLDETDTSFENGKTITLQNPKNTADKLTIVVNSKHVKVSGINYLNLNSVSTSRVSDSLKDDTTNYADFEEIKYNNSSVSVTKDENTINITQNRILKSKDSTTRYAILVDLNVLAASNVGQEKSSGIELKTVTLDGSTVTDVAIAKTDKETVAKFGGSGNQFVLLIDASKNATNKPLTLEFKNNNADNINEKITLNVNFEKSFIDLSKAINGYDSTSNDTSIEDLYIDASSIKELEFYGEDPREITINGVTYKETVNPTSKAKTGLNKLFNIGGEEKTADIYRIKNNRLEIAKAYLVANAETDKVFNIKIGNATYKVQVFSDTISGSVDFSVDSNNADNIKPTTNTTSLVTLITNNSDDMLTLTFNLVDKTSTLYVGNVVSETKDGIKVEKDHLTIAPLKDVTITDPNMNEKTVSEDVKVVLPRKAKTTIKFNSTLMKK